MTELNHDRLWSGTCIEDKDVSVRLGVYKGNASFALFKKEGGGPFAKFAVATIAALQLSKDLNEALKQGPGWKGQKITIMCKYNPDTKKREEVGAFLVLRDDKHICLGFSVVGGGIYRFPIRTPMTIDLPGMEDVVRTALAVQDMIRVLTEDVRIAILITSEKREMGNRPGGGGGYRGGGGGGGASRGNADLDDAIAF